MKVAILSNFQDLNPGYSLTGIVSDQARMLKKYGHEVHLFVCEVFNDKHNDEGLSENAIIEKKVPFAHLTDYRSRSAITAEHQMTAKATTKMLVDELSQGYEIVFTHDWVFTGWNLPYAMGIQEASKALPNIRWMHWIHSVPAMGFDWWQIREYGSFHKIIFPNKTDIIRVAEAYNGEVNDVRVIHHIKDLRSWFEFDKVTCDFIDDFPGVMQADVVMVVPSSTDRLAAKRVDETIRIVSSIKEKGLKVCFVCANQWATGKQPKENVNRYRQIAGRNGLKVNEEFIFTSEWRKEYATGLPKRVLRELFQCSNLFIFPTKEESFGLVVPEAALAGGVLLVLNRSLQMLYEVAGFNGIYFDFGSFHNQFKADNPKQYFDDIAKIIIGRMRQNEGIMAKTFMRQKYNYDYLYRKEYEPVMAESKTW